MIEMAEPMGCAQSSTVVRGVVSNVGDVTPRNTRCELRTLRFKTSQSCHQEHTLFSLTPHQSTILKQTVTLYKGKIAKITHSTTFSYSVLVVL